MITQVDAGSAGEAAGLQMGDVIVGVGSQRIANAAETAHAIHAAAQQGGAVLLRIIHDGRAMFVAVDPGRSVEKG